MSVTVAIRTMAFPVVGVSVGEIAGGTDVVSLRAKLVGVANLRTRLVVAANVVVVPFQQFPV